MYKALESFTTKNYDVHRKQILEDDFTTEDEIQEFLNIGYIEVYDGSLEITENGIYNVENYETADVDVSSSDYLKLTKTFQNIEVSCYIYKPSYTSQALTEAERILNSDDMLIPLLFEFAQADANTLAENIINMGVELIEKLLQLSAVVQDYYLASDVSEAYGLTNPLRLVLSPVSENSFSIYNFIGLFIANIIIEENEQTGEKSINLTGIQQFVLPQGTTQITENGTYDVKEFESAEINVVGDYNAIIDGTFPYANSRYLYAQITEINSVDLSNRTNCQDLFSSMFSLKKIQNCIFSNNIQSTNSMFANCRALIEAPNLGTSKVTDMEQMFVFCQSMTTVPIYDMSKVNYLNNMFYGCNSLTNESLNNILYMLSHATSYTRQKTLQYVGLSQSQATTCTTLSNWAAAEAAGWTTGY